MPKSYRPADHEDRIRARWEASGAFHADPERVLRGEARPYCILIPPPNVTDRLHLGHALNNTLQDVLARAHRMMGFETLWMPGTDHAGIATQAVVERRLRKEGKLKGALKESMEREEFVALVQAFKDEYEATITGQLRSMGCSCDWARQRFTMDEVCARAVYEAFFRLFRDGLIYRGKRLVNWDPVLQTAVSDDETEDLEIDGHMYYLRYPLVHPHGAVTQRELSRGKPAPDDAVPVTWSELRARGWPGEIDAEHADEKQAWVTVATTRPETYLGDTAVAVNPRDPRARPLRGLCVELPIVGRVIPVIEDEYVVMPNTPGMSPALGANPADEASGRGYARDSAEDDLSPGVNPKAAIATGFLKVTPAHDPNDYEIGQRHSLPMINVLAPDGTISDRHGWTDVKGAHVFVGKSREDARKLVIREFQDRTVGGETGAVTLFAKSVPYRHSVPHSDRSKAAIEPYLSDQWYVRVTDDRMRGAALAAMNPGQRTKGGTEGGTEGGAGLRPAAGPATPSLSQEHDADVWPPSGGPPTGRHEIRPAAPGTPPPPLPVTRNLLASARRLPHFQQGGSTYFVTFRLASGTLDEAERQIVLDACLYWHGIKALIRLATVMPDHVHILLHPMQQIDGAWRPLGTIMHSIKSYSAHQINKKRGAAGSVWQEEWFDRIVRDADEFDEKWNYMWQNPVKAGLVAQPQDYRFSASPQRPEIGGAPTGGWDTLTNRAQGSPGGGPEARPTLRVSGDGEMTFYPARYAKTFETWHENIRDWCISRQLWWGHRIPVWRGSLVDWLAEQVDWSKVRHERGQIDITFGRPQTVKDVMQLLGHLQSRGSVSIQAQNGRSLGSSDDDLRRLISEPCFVCLNLAAPNATDAVAILDALGFARDPDVLDTWFSSGLWPMSTMGWPDPASAGPEFTGLLEAFNPSSTLCTAREIITLWVSRMTMFNRYFMPEGWPKSHDFAEDGQGRGPPPFRDVFIHAMIQDGEGRKMSKSLGNGVDPLDIIATHGADAMRYTLVKMTTQTQDVRMPVVNDPATGRNTSPKFDEGRNFCNKLWQVATGFALAKLSQPAEDERPRPVKELRLIDRWMLSRLEASLRQIDAAIKGYEFSDYAESVYRLLWWDFCDWYVEGVKPTIAADGMQRAVLAHALETIVRVLHPIAPFVTEAVWERLREVETLPVPGITLAPSRKGDLLATAGWPEIEPSLRDDQVEVEFEQVRTLVNAIREVRARLNTPPRRKVTLHCTPDIDAVARRAGGLVETLAVVDRITSESPPPGAAAFTVGAAACHLSNLADAVDTAAERIRLEKVIADNEKSIRTLEGRLANPGYAERAPPAMVQQTRDQLAKAKAERDAAAQALRSLA